LADQIERACDADETAGRRVRARDYERVAARRRERDCTRSGGRGHGADEFFDAGRARVLRLGQDEVRGGGEEYRAYFGERLVAHRAEDHRHLFRVELVEVCAKRPRARRVVSVVARAFDFQIARRAQRLDAVFAAARAYDLFGLPFLRRDDDVDAGADDGRLLGGYRGERVAEVFLVVE